MASTAVRLYTPDHRALKSTLLLTSTLTVMAGAAAAPALPEIHRVFADTPNIDLLTSLVLTLPALFIVLGAPLVGVLLDRFGRKRMLVAAVTLYALAGSTGLVAPSIFLLLVGRAFLGLAVAGITTSVTTLITDYYTGSARTEFLGFQSAFMGLGGSVFLGLGGVLADIHWRALFFVYAGAFALIPLIVITLVEPDRTRPVVAEPGETLRVRAPVRLMLFVYASLTLIQAVFNVVPIHLPFHIEQSIGGTASASGLAIAWLSLAYSVTAMQAGKLGRRFSHFTLVTGTFVFTGIGFVITSAAQTWPVLLVGLPLIGLGLGLMVPHLNGWLASETPSAIRGRVVGGYTTSIFLGQFISPVISQPVRSAFGIAGLFAVTAGLMAALTCIALLYYVVVQRTQTVRPS